MEILLPKWLEYINEKQTETVLLEMQFLKLLSAADNSYEWPRKDDVADVDRSFLLSGPLQLNGNNPFTFVEFQSMKVLYNNALKCKDKLFPVAEDSD